MLLFPALAAAADPTWESVAPIFAKHCAACHSGTEHEGGLDLANHAAALKGGDSGPSIVPGKPDASNLLLRAEHRAKPVMPPPKQGKKVPEAELAALRAWIAAGAKGPSGKTAPAAVAQPRLAPKKAPPPGIRAAAAHGQLIALARPRIVELRDATTQQVVRTLGPHTGPINALAFSPDGAVLAVAGGIPGTQGLVRVWKVADGQPLATFGTQSDALHAVAISPDGRLLAAGSYDKTIHVWNLADPQPARTLVGHNAAVLALAFRPDGKTLASASEDRTVKLWDIAAGTRLDTRSEPTKAQAALAWSPDGKLLAAAGGDNRLRIWNVSADAKEGSNPLRTSAFAHEGAVLRLAWAPDGQTLASSAADQTVKLWNAADGSLRLALPKQADWATGLAFVGPQRLAVGRLDGGFALHDVATGKVAPAPMPPKPVVVGVQPPGLQRGGAATLRIAGKNLQATTGVKALAANVKARLAGTPTAEALTVVVETPADFPPGDAEFALLGAGAAEYARFQAFVDPLPQHAEAAAAVALPCGAWGAIAERGEIDLLRFVGKRGMKFVADVETVRRGSPAKLAATLKDAAGHALATAVGFDESPEPLLEATLPADGEYVLELREREYAGSAKHAYRVTLGELAIVAAVRPLAVPANAAATVRLIGPNVPADATVEVRAGASGEVSVPIDPARFRVRKAFSVLASATPELVEAEPNDTPAQAGTLPVPGAVHGGFDVPRDADVFRFDAKKGQAIVLETLAAQRGLPTDTLLEIVDAAGKPLPQTLLRATRDSVIEFRPIDANANGVRLWKWEEMDLGQHLYMSGEVVRLRLAPRGPDSTWDFFMAAGKRRNYFHTSAVAHALDEPAYVVEALPPGSLPPPNGLPTFALPWRNDDDPERRLGRDSRLLFDPPADGSYCVRATDVRGSGPRHLYRLSARAAAPDFAVRIEGLPGKLGAGSGRAFAVKLDRRDGFDGPVRVTIANPPPGCRVSSPLDIDAGHDEAEGTMYFDADAPAPPLGATLAAAATATLAGKATTRTLPPLALPERGAKPKTVAWLEPLEPGAREIVLRPGGRVPAKLRIAREKHNQRVSFDVENLPFGAIVDDIGLSGILIPEGQTERTVFLLCAAWTPPGVRPAFAKVREAPNATSAPIMVRVPARGGVAEAAR